MLLFALDQRRLAAWVYNSDAERREHAGREPALEIDGRTAVVHIVGPLVPDMEAAWASWNCSTPYSHVQRLCAEAQARHAAGDVDQLMLVFDSPGGHTSGMVDCAEFIAGLPVPTVAYVRGGCCSAAMYLACAADRIVAPRTAYVGSIGVVCHVRSEEELLRKVGVETKTIRSPETPDKALAPSEDGFDEQMTAVVSEATTAFLEWVAKRRGLSGDLAAATGAGAVLGAQAALALNLIDAIGTRADALAPRTEAPVEKEELEQKIADLESENAELKKDLDETKAKLDAMDDDQGDDTDDADDADKADSKTEAAVDTKSLEAKIEAALRAQEARFEGRLTEMGAKVQRAEAEKCFADLLAKKLVAETERPRYLRDHRLAHAPDATQEDKDALAEYAARQPLAPSERTSHGHTQAGQDPLSPAAVQAHADEHFGGDYNRALAHLAAKG